MASSQAASKWIDPDAAAPEPRARVVREVVSRRDEIDRFHNNEALSPEALAKALDELRTSMSELQDRVAAVEEGAAGVVGAAKGLGLGMLQMGDALSKRVGALEQRALEPAPVEVEIQAPAATGTVAAEVPVQPSLELEPASEPAPMFIASKTAPKSGRLRIALGLGVVAVIAVGAFLVLRPHAAPAAGAPPAQVLYSPTISGQ
jgi:hypothetical protein